MLLLTKSAAIWLRTRDYDLQTLTWQQLKTDVMDTFKPDYYHRHAHDELAICVQKGPVTSYIDRMKCIQRKVHGITDDECWIDLSTDWSQSLAMRFLRRTYKPLKKLVYLPNEFCKSQTWLVEVAHVVNGVNLQIMPQWNQIVWALVSAVVNLKKVSKTTNPINLAQPALFVAKRATLPENAGTTPPDHPL